VAKLSMEEIGKLAEAAWGGDATRDDQGASLELVNAVAVAMAESDGESTAHNTTYPDDSYGLWQINMLGKMGADRRKAFGIASNADLFDPNTNARAAHQVWRDAGKSFSPWSTFTNGAYLSFVPQARTALGNRLGSPPTSDISDYVGAIADAVAGIAQAVWKTMVWVSDPHNWARAITVGVGGALVIGALVVLAKPNTGVVDAVTAAPKAAVKTAAKPVKLAAKVAV
jgi:hypothetical protein